MSDPLDEFPPLTEEERQIRDALLACPDPIDTAARKLAAMVELLREINRRKSKMLTVPLDEAFLEQIRKQDEEGRP